MIIAYGAFLGAMLASTFHPDGASWSAAATIVRDITTAGGILIGGWWAYQKYFRQREGEERADLIHHITTVEVDDKLLLRVVLEIKNVGPVAIEPAGGELLVQIPKRPVVNGDDDPHRIWTTIRSCKYPFRGNELCIEPGVAERYCRDVVVDADVRVVQLHSRVFTHDDKGQWDETTVHELKPKPASVPSVQEVQIERSRISV